MSKKKNVTISTQGWKSKAQKKEEERHIHIGAVKPHAITCEMQLYARSISGTHDAHSKKSSTKNPKGRKAAKVECRNARYNYNNKDL